MFAYCLNNPVNMFDTGGCFSIGLATILAVGASLLLGYIFTKSSDKTGRNSGSTQASDVLKAVAEEIIPGYEEYNNFRSIGNELQTADKKIMQLSKDTVNAAYAKSNNLSFSTSNVDSTVFGSDLEYSRYCLSQSDNLILNAQACGINIRGKRWEELSDYEQEIIADNAIIWASSATYDISKNAGVKAGFGVAF